MWILYSNKSRPVIYFVWHFYVMHLALNLNHTWDQFASQNATRYRYMLSANSGSSAVDSQRRRRRSKVTDFSRDHSDWCRLQANSWRRRRMAAVPRTITKPPHWNSFKRLWESRDCRQHFTFLCQMADKSCILYDNGLILASLFLRHDRFYKTE